MRRWPCIAAAPGAAFVLVDTALALALGNSSVFVPLLVIGPLVAAALASPRCTRRRRCPGGRRARSRWGSPTTASSRPSTSARWRRSPPAACWPCSPPRAGAATRRRCSTSAPRAGARTSWHGPGNCSTRRPSPRRCCARSCGWPCPTWPSCASWISCTTASSARRRPTPPTRARWRCCTPRASRYPLDPDGAAPRRRRRPHGPPAPAARDRSRAPARVRGRRASTSS